MPNTNTPDPSVLAERLNPTASTIQTPTSGLFRAQGDIGTAIYNAKGQQLDLVNSLGGGAANGNAGGQSNAAIAALKSLYGIDYNSLPSVNIGDYVQNQNKTWTGAPTGFQFQTTTDHAAFFGANGTQRATLSPTTINNTPNTLAPASSTTSPTSSSAGGGAGDPRLEAMRQSLLAGSAKLTAMGAPPLSTIGNTVTPPSNSGPGYTPPTNTNAGTTALGSAWIWPSARTAFQRTEPSMLVNLVNNEGIAFLDGEPLQEGLRGDRSVSFDSHRADLRGLPLLHLEVDHRPRAVLGEIDARWRDFRFGVA